mmetsp:Transcript_34955/g.39646  ORF Transcript_34955/g.39646 Transcript_34955/m.39646 type:complete len:202 (+) Transcript_34955:114-719(+)
MHHLPVIKRRGRSKKQGKTSNSRLSKDFRSLEDLKQSIFENARNIKMYKHRINQICEGSPKNVYPPEYRYSTLHRESQKNKSYLSVKIPSPIATEDDETCPHLFDRSFLRSEASEIIEGRRCVPVRVGLFDPEDESDHDTDDTVLDIIKRSRGYYRRRIHRVEPPKDKVISTQLRRVTLTPLRKRKVLDLVKEKSPFMKFP